ncbi:tetratricopeptide repeat-containing glycosyltransferase [Mycolicibacterium helvum]|uniref:Beta 1,4 glucosyltransferase n=1 Tax=Mycolicibacterium helvum TaxID=1534349 RepID=A0A7I7T1Z6_9MYCO|nr:glycosyltransferase [Mycolicibacterium helvum]BBY62970.1 beta 1,4 glucosyltransferase [Mycolicibacterium helvum]
MSRYKVCVYAICKNEEKFVDRWMDAVDEADIVVVLDTGSTDSTVEKLRSRGARVYQEIVTPWRFDTARNIAMSHIPEDVDICVSNDLDEVFEPGWRKALEAAWEPETTYARYLFVWNHRADGSAEQQFPMEKIHRRKHFRWVHPVHEILQYDGPDPHSVPWVDGMVLHHYPDATKARSQYLPLLELSAEENPEDGRTIFWLGREYMYYGMNDECISTLNDYLRLPAATWDVERCAAMRFISRSYQAKGEGMQAEVWLYRAVAECPQSREPFYAMAILAYLRKDWSLVMSMVEKTLAITDDVSGYLRDEVCWGASPHDLGAIACYWLGLYERSRDYAATALEIEPDDQRLADNLRLAVEKLETE